jgi:RimJ/RimL family protein N-acetyltransferase
MNFPAIPLTTHGVQLQPLTLAHAEGLATASGDGSIGQLPFTTAPTAELQSATAYVHAALAGQTAGTMLPFAVLADGRIVGSTRLYDINPTVPNLAIGYTWYAASMQRSHVNTACKLLLLGHAFEALGMCAVYFHTSHLNLRSQAAIERLGAQRDGILRAHLRHKDGSLRDTFSYSILAGEWPAVRARLGARLGEVAQARATQSTPIPTLPP